MWMSIRLIANWYKFTYCVPSGTDLLYARHFPRRSSYRPGSVQLITENTDRDDYSVPHQTKPVRHFVIFVRSEVRTRINRGS